MEAINSFTAALNLSGSWKVEKAGFKPTEDGKLELHIEIGFTKGGQFSCPHEGCAERATAYDTSEWSMRTTR